MPTDPRRVPLDPRTVECQGCGGHGNILHTINTEGYEKPAWTLPCEPCQGTGRVPLHPEPTVEVWSVYDGTPEQPTFGYYYCIDGVAGPLGTLHTTPADAIRAARLAWLGARLSSRGCEVIVVVPVGERVWNVLASGPTADAAIEAAFAMRDQR